MTTIDAITVETLLTHSNFVRGLARALVGDPAIADDAVQQAWLEACERPPKDMRSPKGWLATVTRQAASKIRRSETRRRTREQRVARPELVPSAAEIAEREEARRRLMDAVVALDEPYREVIVLRFLEELPPREVARRLGVPVETARTRVKRGLEQLRGALDSAYGGDRRGWGMALLPFALPKTAAAAPKVIALAASLVLVGALSWSLGWLPGSTRPRASSLSGASPIELPGGATGAAAGPLLATTGSEASEPMRAGAGQGNPPPVDRVERRVIAAPVSGVLALEARLARAVVLPGDQVVLTCTFENTGAGKLEFFVPEHAGLVPFPSWRLTSDNGDTYVPESPSFQSGWTYGIQGTVYKLAAKKTWSSKSRATRFYKLVPGTERRLQSNAVRLPPGHYRVQCSYTQATAEVPYGLPNFQLRNEKVPGLWTGTVSAAPLVLHVADPLEPNLIVRAPDDTVAGGPARVQLVVRNPPTRTLALTDMHILIHGSKGGGGGSALVPTGAIERSDGAGELAVAAGGKLAVEVDLARLAFAPLRKNGKGPFGLYELGPQGNIRCSASWHVAGVEQPLVSDVVWVRIRPRAPAAIAGLELTVKRAGGSLIQVTLTNVGTRSIRVRKRLSWPADVRVSLTDAAKKRAATRTVTSRGTSSLDGLMDLQSPARIASGLSWNGESYERPGPLVAGDFDVLPPEGVVSRIFDLSKMVWGKIPAGRYEVRAVWRSLTSGVHLGLPPAVVGVLESRPIVVEIAGK